MRKLGRLLPLLLICFAIPLSSYADEKKKEAEKEEKNYDFENEETFMDVPDALRSRQFVHRAILSTIIRDTVKVSLGTWYVNHLMGFNAIYQPANRGGKSFAKYVSGVIGFAGGYVTEGGHAIELGVDLSANSLMFFNYKKLMGGEGKMFWPYFGLGAGMEMGFFRLTDLPPEAKVYQGSTTMGFFTIGTLVPLVDLALKVEARFIFFGLDRLMLSTGAGVVFFL